MAAETIRYGKYSSDYDRVGRAIGRGDLAAVAAHLPTERDLELLKAALAHQLADEDEKARERAKGLVDKALHMYETKRSGFMATFMAEDRAHRLDHKYFCALLGVPLEERDVRISEVQDRTPKVIQAPALGGLVLERQVIGPVHHPVGVMYFLA